MTGENDEIYEQYDGDYEKYIPKYANYNTTNSKFRCGTLVRKLTRKQWVMFSGLLLILMIGIVIGLSVHFAKPSSSTTIIPTTTTLTTATLTKMTTALKRTTTATTQSVVLTTSKTQTALSEKFLAVLSTRHYEKSVIIRNDGNTKVKEQ